MADFVIDAAGGTHWLARQLKLTIEKHSPPLFAYYGYAKGECHFRDEAPAIVITPEGWIWTAKAQEHLYQWTRLYFNKNKNDNNQLVPSRGWLPDEFKGLKPVEFVRSANVTWRLVVRPAGLGYFIVGDAATVLDPSSAHGVLRALMSGIMASHAILRIVHDGIPSGIVIKSYNDWLSNWFFHDIERLKDLYRFKSVNL
jgi:flavin-dependent dehydrogenase